MNLSDLTVVELANILAGPSVGMFFAELGAKVIKVENETTNGDPTRQWRLPQEDKKASVSAYYCSVNWNKEVVFANLKEPAGQGKVHQLIKNADIVISNFKPGDAQKLGMDYPTLCQLNPQLIYGHITGYAGENPRPAFDVILQAECGWMSMNGNPESGPTKMPVALMDLLAGHQLKEGLLLALLKRERTGKGSMVKVTLEESAIASLANQASNYLMVDHIPQRMGSLHPNIAPYGDVFTTKDGKDVVLAIGTDKHFSGLCNILGTPALAQDEKFLHNHQRVQNRALLDAALAPLFQKINRDELLQQCHEQKIPVGAVKDMAEVFENAVAQAMVLEETMEDGTETRRVKTAAFSIS